MVVIKRDGREVDFDKDKISKAILKAFTEVEKLASVGDKDELSKKITDRLYRRYQRRNRAISVEEIQDDVETELMKEGELEVAKAYIRYRYLHKIARDRYEELMSAVAEKLEATNVQNQNANVDERSFGGRVGEASSVVTRSFALNYLVSPMAKANHENNEIYIHDLDAYAVGSHNCLSIPFDDLLANGFNTRQTDVRPAQSVSTAFQLLAVIFQLQSLQQFGGVSATHLDWTMVPYVRKSFHKHYLDGLKYCDSPALDGCIDPELSRLDPDVVVKTSITDKTAYDRSRLAYEYAMDMTEREIHQAVEGMYHNLK